MTDPLGAGTRVVLVLLAFLVLPLVVGQVEHKLVARLQGRVGPMYAGYHGWAQLLADGVKFAQKVDVLPTGADRAVSRLAPGAALVPYLVALAFMPLAPGWVGADVDAGLLVVVALLSVALIGSMLGRWASSGASGAVGTLRGTAEALWCLLVVLLAALSAAMAGGTFSLTGIVEQWHPLWLLWQAIGGVVFFVAGLGALRRPPFDATSDLPRPRGVSDGYSGLRFAAFVFAEYAGLLLVCGLTTVLFLGGWRGPGPEAFAAGWTMVKVFVLVGVAVWLGATLPRLRGDQLRRLVWHGLAPLAVVQLAITTVLVL
ncbi:MAG: complex I subunit 1/NuoH family protein [Actinomycetota bacterium]